MSKQYLTTHTIDHAHPTDIFSLSTTASQILSSSGSSSIQVHSTNQPDFPLFQTLDNAHKLGCHHTAISRNGQVAASVGFGGEVKIWAAQDGGRWGERTEIVDGNKVGETWAIALSEDGQYLAATSFDGRINVWDNLANGAKIREFETKGSFGMSIDLMEGLLPLDMRMVESISSIMILEGLVKPVRAVAFSPRGTLLAAAGDSRVIALYDVSSGDQVATLTGHRAWVFSLDWSDTGEYLLSGAFDGKAKVWSIEQRTCVATHTETEKTLWSVKWLPKIGKNEGFATAGANRSISFYREATGG
ncbi:MAG: superkiller [Alectoria sarmentosa]|nr:MAG: superkiller [Alectoria sarmentosa]